MVHARKPTSSPAKNGMAKVSGVHARITSMTGQHQRSSTQIQHNSTPKRERSERAARQINTSASTVSRSAPAKQKMHLAVDFYYLVTMMCRFKVLCLLTPPGVDPSFLRPVISKHQLSAFSFQPPDQCDRIGRPGQFDHQLLAEGR
jgi:hypothetical protein